MKSLEAQRLRTDRLQLIAATFEHVCAEMESPEDLVRLLGTQVDAGWPPGEYDRDAQEFFRDRLKECGPPVVGWYGWYAIAREERDRPSTLVGTGGYLGPPNEKGEVEIGFSMMPLWQGRGYATEMAEALVAKAFADLRVRKVLARTASGNTASIKVLLKCGFRRLRKDHESGYDLFQILRPKRR